MSGGSVGWGGGSVGGGLVGGGGSVGGGLVGGGLVGAGCGVLDGAGRGVSDGAGCGVSEDWGRGVPVGGRGVLVGCGCEVGWEVEAPVGRGVAVAFWSPPAASSVAEASCETSVSSGREARFPPFPGVGDGVAKSPGVTVGLPLPERAWAERVDATAAWIAAGSRTCSPLSSAMLVDKASMVACRAASFPPLN